MVQVYFTKKEWLRNEYIYQYFDRSRFIDTSMDGYTWTPSKENELIIFQKLEMRYFNTFSRKLKEHGDVERADEHAEYMARMHGCITVTVHQYHLFNSLMEIYSSALIASIIKRGSGCLADNRMDARAACRKWLNIKCEIDGVEHKGKLGASFDVDELADQEELNRKTCQKKQMLFLFLRKVVLSFVLLLVVSFSCHVLWTPVETPVLESFDFYPTQFLADLSFAAESIASMIDDNSMASAAIDEPKNIFAIFVSCLNNSCTVAAPADVPVHTNLDIERTPSFDSFDNDPPETVQVSSILPYQNCTMDMHIAHATPSSQQQEARDLERDFEMRLEQKASIQLKFVQDEPDYERAQHQMALIYIVAIVMGLCCCVSCTRTVALNTPEQQQQQQQVQPRGKQPTAWQTPTRTQPHRAAKSKPTPIPLEEVESPIRRRTGRSQSTGVSTPGRIQLPRAAKKTPASTRRQPNHEDW